MSKFLHVIVLRAKDTVADLWCVVLQVALWYAAYSAAGMENSTSFAYLALIMYHNSHKKLNLAILSLLPISLLCSHVHS